MPTLKTVTIRTTETQFNELRSPAYKGRSSFLFRALLELYKTSTTPYIDLQKLKQQMALPEEKFKELKG